MGFLIFVVLVIFFFIFKAFLNKQARQLAEEDRRAKVEARKESIYQKYGHTENAERIINKIIWLGETSEQLSDSFGKPLDIDEQVFKTKKKEVWKYYQKSTNRYGLKITIENGVVIGWDEKL